MVGAQLHSGVNVSSGGNTGLQQTNALIDHGDQDAVDHETGSLVDFNGSLAQFNGQILDLLHQFGRGVGAGDDFDQLHIGSGVKEMHTHHLVLQTKTDLGDGQRGGVGCKNSLGLDDLVQFLQQNLLGGHVFLDGLQNQIAIGTGGLLFDLDVVQDGINSLLGHLALFHALLQTCGQFILVALSAGRRAGEQISFVAGLSEHLSDAAAHGTGAKYCYLHA